MKRLLCLVLAMLAVLALATSAEAPLTGYVLRESEAEVTVFANPSSKANIVGYLQPGGEQEVEVLSVSGDWCLVRFTAEYGEGAGYVPLSCFTVEAPATPTPRPETLLTYGTEAWVCNAQSGYRLNLRTGPELNATSLGKYYSGVPVTATGAISGGYAQVLIHGVLGWMDVRYLTTDASFPVETPLVQVNNPGGGINLREGPAADTPFVYWVPHGSDVIVLGACVDGWYHVEIDGRTGYVTGSLLSETLPFQYGTDSDNPAVSGDLAGAAVTLYVCNLSDNGQLNLRKTPAASGAILGRFYTGTPAELISYTRTGWAYVRIGQLEGYMDADYLSNVRPQHYGQTRTVRNGYGTGMNLRNMPSTDGKIIAFLDNYTRVTVLGDLTNDWCYVDIGGTLGYVLGTRLQ